MEKENAYEYVFQLPPMTVFSLCDILDPGSQWIDVGKFSAN